MALGGVIATTTRGAQPNSEKPAPRCAGGHSGKKVRGNQSSLDFSSHDPDRRAAVAETLAISAAALDLDGQIRIAAELFQAWMKDKNPCARSAIGAALLQLGAFFHSKDQEARGGRYYPQPFSACSLIESSPVRLTITGRHGSTLRVTIQNVSSKPVLFYKYRSPAEMFSITVLDSSGARAMIRNDKNFQFLPPVERSRLADQRMLGSHLPFPMALQPGQQTVWDWDATEEFELKPNRSYRISMGGYINYLHVDLCSGAMTITCEGAEPKPDR